MAFYYDTCTKLREIFMLHCNLSMEQYEEISEKLVFLVTDYDMDEPAEEIEKRVRYLTSVFEFLTNTGELTLNEYTDLMDMLSDIISKAEKERGKKILQLLEDMGVER